MKLLIKQILREGLLTEALPDVDSDVNLLYDKFFKDDVDTITTTGSVDKNMFDSAKVDTSILTSDICVEAHSKNPCDILINHSSNYYNPGDRVISLGINQGALEFLKNVNIGTGVEGVYRLDLALGSLDRRSKVRFENEFKEHKIKGSINHELLHWLDDTLHNKSISKFLSRASEVGKDVYLKGKDVNTSKMEIQAQMGNIKQLKNKFSDMWDYLSFNDLIGMSVSLSVIYDSLRGRDRDEWVRNLKTRMYREGLLGKKMYN